MASSAGKAHCIICGKARSTFKCAGRLKEFCFNHLADHKQELSKQLDEIEVTRDVFRQNLTEQITNVSNDTSIQQIDEWERESINKIQQTAEESRQLILQHTSKYVAKLDDDLRKLTDNLRQSRDENDFNERDLQQFKEKLTWLTKELNKPSNISIQQGSIPLINKIFINVSLASINTLNISPNTRWFQNAITVAGGNGYGEELDKLRNPFGIYVDDDQAVYVADYSNNRIVRWKSGAKSGQVVVGGNGSGNRADQLCSPTDVIVHKQKNCLIICDRGNQRVVQWPLENGTKGQIIISDIDCYGLTADKDGYLYVTDQKKHEVIRWQIGKTERTVVAGGNGNGDHLNQLNNPFFVFVDQDLSVYVSDQDNHRVMKWTKGATEGIVVAGGHGPGCDLRQLSAPTGIAVDELGTIYVADYSNHRVIRWLAGAEQGSIIVGGNGKKQYGNQLDDPLGLSLDRSGNLYVVDLGNNRVQRFDIDSTSNL